MFADLVLRIGEDVSYRAAEPDVAGVSGPALTGVRGELGDALRSGVTGSLSRGRRRPAGFRPRSGRQARPLGGRAEGDGHRAGRSAVVAQDRDALRRPGRSAVTDHRAEGGPQQRDQVRGEVPQPALVPAARGC